MTGYDFINRLSESAIKNMPELQPWANQFRLRASEFAFFLKNYQLPKNSEILEIGCGNAFNAALLSHIATKVVATDLPRQNHLSHSIGIEQASRLLQNLRVHNCNLVACDAQNLPFLDSTFDIVFNNYILEHIPDRDKTVKDMKRVLKPNGLCISIVPSYIERLSSIPAFYIYLSKRLAHYLLNSLGKKKKNSMVKMESLISGFPKRYSNFPLPPPHGYYFSWREELFAHLPHRWDNLFTRCGFKAEKVFSLMFMPWNLIEAINSNYAVWLYKKSIWFSKYICNLGLFRYCGYNLCFVLRKNT